MCQLVLHLCRWSSAQMVHTFPVSFNSDYLGTGTNHLALKEVCSPVAQEVKMLLSCHMQNRWMDGWMNGWMDVCVLHTNILNYMTVI